MISGYYPKEALERLIRETKTEILAIETIMLKLESKRLANPNLKHRYNPNTYKVNQALEELKHTLAEFEAELKQLEGKI